MIENRKHPRRLVKDGVFAVIDGNPFKIDNIGLGGASFSCDDVSFLNIEKQKFEILVMDGSINYIKNIPHSLVPAPAKAPPKQSHKNMYHVRVLFGDLSEHQHSQFKMLLGLS